MKSKSVTSQHASRDVLHGGSVANSRLTLKPGDSVVVQFGSWTSGPSPWSPDLRVAVPNGEVARRLGELVDVTYTVNGTTISPPLTVNVVSFRDQDRQLPAPTIVEAIDGALVLGTFDGPGHARVTEWPLKWPGQRVSMQLSWDSGSLDIVKDFIVRESDMGAALVFDIPRDRLDEIPDNTDILLTCRVVFSGGDDASAVRFPIAEYRLQKQLAPDPGPIGLVHSFSGSLALSPDEKWLFGWSEHGGRFGRIARTSVAGLEPLQELGASWQHEINVTYECFMSVSQNGRFVVTSNRGTDSSTKATLGITDIPQLKSQQVGGLYFYGVGVTADDLHVFAVSGDPATELSIFQVTNLNSVIHRIPVTGGGLCMASDGRYAYASRSRAIVVIDQKTFAVHEIDAPFACDRLAITPNGRFIVGTNSDQSAVIIDMVTRQTTVRDIGGGPINEFGPRTRCIGLSGDSRTVAFARNDGCELLDLRTGLARVVEHKARTGLALNYDATRLYACDFTDLLNIHVYAI